MTTLGCFYRFWEYVFFDLSEWAKACRLTVEPEIPKEIDPVEWADFLEKNKNPWRGPRQPENPSLV